MLRDEVARTFIEAQLRTERCVPACCAIRSLAWNIFSKSKANARKAKKSSKPRLNLLEEVFELNESLDELRETRESGGT